MTGYKKIDDFLTANNIVAVRLKPFYVRHLISHYTRYNATHQPYALSNGYDLIHRTGGRDYWYFARPNEVFTLRNCDSQKEVVFVLGLIAKGEKL
jgi:hypothetical protein